MVLHKPKLFGTTLPKIILFGSTSFSLILVFVVFCQQNWSFRKTSWFWQEFIALVSLNSNQTFETQLLKSHWNWVSLKTISSQSNSVLSNLPMSVNTLVAPPVSTCELSWEEVSKHSWNFPTTTTRLFFSVVVVLWTGSRVWLSVVWEQKWDHLCA